MKNYRHFLFAIIIALTDLTILRGLLSSRRQITDNRRNRLLFARYFRSVAVSDSNEKTVETKYIRKFRTHHFATTRDQKTFQMEEIRILPALIVFDLDMCMWTPETYELDFVPEEKHKIMGTLGRSGLEGVVAVNCGGHQYLKLFPGSLLALQQFVDGKYYQNNENGEDRSATRLAVASSAVTPLAVEIAHAGLNMLEVYPGVTVRMALAMGWEDHGDQFSGNLKIGRSPPLSSSKANTHFPLLHQDTGIPYDRMLYFDDCIWDDHCGIVERKFPGIVTYRTPQGLQESDWINALKKYEQIKSTP